MEPCKAALQGIDSGSCEQHRFVFVFQIPVTAISENNVVYIVDSNNELELRELSILKKYSDFVIVKEGIRAGERIVTSKLSTASNGIKVNPVYK